MDDIVLARKDIGTSYHIAVTHDDAMQGMTHIVRGEDHVMRVMDKFPVQLTRLANVYGYSKNLRIESEINRMMFDAHFNNRISVHGEPEHQLSYISLFRTVEMLAQIAINELPSDIYNLAHRTLSAFDMIEALKAFYPVLETIFVDQHMPQKNLTMTCDDRLKPMLPLETSMTQDIAKFRELFTF